MKAKIKKFFKINKEDGSNNEEVSLVSILKENNEEGGDSKAQFLEKSENKVDQKYDEVIKELEQKAQLDMLFTEEQLAREQNSNYEEMTIDESYELMGEVIKAPESYNVLSNFFSLLRKVKTSVRSILEKKLRLGLELSKQIKTSLQFTTLSRLISKNQVGGIANLLLRKIEESRKNKVKSMISSGAGVSILVGRSSIRTLQKLTEFDMNVPKGQLGRQITSLPKQILTSLQERLLQNRIDIQTSKKEIEARLERKDMKPGFATTNITGPSTEAYRILPQLLNKTTAALTLQNIIKFERQREAEDKAKKEREEAEEAERLRQIA